MKRKICEFHSIRKKVHSEKKIERQHVSVRLSRISISEATRSAHRSSRARAPFHFFLSSMVYSFHFSPSPSPRPPLYPLLLSRDSSLPSLCFSFPPPLFFCFFSACSIRAVGFYYISSRVFSSEDLPAPPRVLQKKGRGARREERNVGMRDTCPTRICDTVRFVAKNYSRNVREWIEHGANIVGVLEPAITGLTARPRLVHGHFRQPSGGPPRGPVSEYI